MRWPLALLLVAACDVRVLTFEGDGGIVGDATIFPDLGACKPIMEQCNGIDDDCDCPGDTNGDGLVCGVGDVNVDEDDPLDPTDDLPDVGESCGDVLGECDVGVTVCAPTPGCILAANCVACSGNVNPTNELCNNLDDDCDDETDEPFNFCTDRSHCGDCATDCTLTGKPLAMFHATFECNACVDPGNPCKVIGCAPGYANCNDLDFDGCECECGLLHPGPEICDGEDNDCDGLVDLTDPSMLAPPFCRQTGECMGTVAQCVADARCSTCVAPEYNTCWICDYGPSVEMSTTNPCIPSNVELSCDDLDGNCNLLTDEGFSEKAQPCDNGGIGSCAVRGEFICDPTDPSQTVCDVAGAPGNPPANELCDGEDNNCNGMTDENQDHVPSGTLGVRDDFVHINRSGLDFYMYAYEASRPGATDSDFGDFQHRACSSPNVLPWASVSRDEAIAACQAAGLELCDDAQWDAACFGAAAPAAGDDFPYGEPYNANACNGKEFDPPCASGGDDCVVPTGSLATCDTPDGIFDLSGNLKEWTEDPEPDPPATPQGYRPRGGSFDNIAGGMSCDFKFTVLPTAFRHENLGFRCCCTAGANCPPP